MKPFDWGLPTFVVRCSISSSCRKSLEIHLRDVHLEEGQHVVVEDLNGGHPGIFEV